MEQKILAHLEHVGEKDQADIKLYREGKITTGQLEERQKENFLFVKDLIEKYGFLLLLRVQKRRIGQHF